MTVSTETQYATDWSEYAVGVRPAGWVLVHDSTIYYKVVADTSAASGRFLQWSAMKTSRNRFGLAYTGFGDVADQEVYTEFRVASVSLGSSPEAYYMGVAGVREGGTATSERGYMARLVYDPRNGGREFHLITFLNGGTVRLATVPYAWTEGQWYSVRLQAVGTAIRVRIWPRGTAEPATWTLSAVNSYYATGKPGVFNFDNGTVQWDFWSAGVAGASAPGR